MKDRIKDTLDVVEETDNLLAEIRTLIKAVNSEFGEVANKTEEADRLWRLLSITLQILEILM